MAFNVEALERGIEQCKKNIKTFEDAIEREMNTIKEYRKQIDHNLEQEAIDKQKQAVIDSIEVVRE